MTCWMYTPLYHVVLLIGLLSGRWATMVKWEMREWSWRERDEGGNVTFKCVVHHLNSAYSAVSVERSAGGSTRLVSTNQRVEDAFRGEMHAGRRRYSARFEMMRETMGYIGILYLTILDLKSEDAGLMRCKAEGEQTPLKTLAVRVPVQAVYMSAFQQRNNHTPARLPDGATVTLTESRRGGVACAVLLRTRLIAPEVRLTSGGRKVTELFAPEPPLPVAGAARPTYLWEYRMYTQRPNPELHDRKLKCSAFAVGYETLVQSAHVKLEVEFRPRIMCMHYEYWGYVGGSTMMTCAVKSNPKAAITFRFGYFLSDNQYRIAAPIMADGQYVFTRQESVGGVSNMTATLHNLRKAHFDYKYKMEAFNTYGSASVTLELYESSPVGTASPQHQKASALTALLLLVTWLVTWLTSCLPR